MLLVILVPDLVVAQRIAFFGENVHILYVSEMDQNSRFLLLTCTPEHPQKVMISRCNMQFGQIEAYGKYPAKS